MKSFPRHEWLIVLILAFLAAMATWIGSGLVDPIILDWDAEDVWFQADVPRNYHMMISRWSYSHYRTNVHPLLSLIAHPPVWLVKHITKVDPLLALRMVMAGVAALCIGLLYTILRLVGC